MHKKLREAKLKLVIKTDIKDISSVGQSPKRVTPAQGTKFKCVGYGWNWDESTNSLDRSDAPLKQNLLDAEIKILLRLITTEKLVKHRDCHFSIFFFHLNCTHKQHFEWFKEILLFVGHSADGKIYLIQVMQWCW